MLAITMILLTTLPQTGFSKTTVPKPREDSESDTTKSILSTTRWRNMSCTGGTSGVSSWSCINLSSGTVMSCFTNSPVQEDLVQNFSVIDDTDSSPLMCVGSIHSVEDLLSNVPVSRLSTSPQYPHLVVFLCEPQPRPLLSTKINITCTPGQQPSDVDLGSRLRHLVSDPMVQITLSCLLVLILLQSIGLCCCHLKWRRYANKHSEENVLVLSRSTQNATLPDVTSNKTLSLPRKGSIERQISTSSQRFDVVRSFKASGLWFTFELPTVVGGHPVGEISPTDIEEQFNFRDRSTYIRFNSADSDHQNDVMSLPETEMKWEETSISTDTGSQFTLEFPKRIRTVVHSPAQAKKSDIKQ